MVCEASNLKGLFRLMTELFRQKDLFKEALSYMTPLLGRRASVRRSHAVVAARGKSRVEEVDVARLDNNWHPIPGTEKTHNVDLVGIGFGFQPMARLCRLAGCTLQFDTTNRSLRPDVDSFMRTSEANIYAAGDSTGIGGKQMAEVEGRIAALHATAELGHLSASDLDRSIFQLNREKRKIVRYISCLEKMFTPGNGIFDLVHQDTVICRCEEVTAADILGAIQNKHLDINSIKKRTRLGMGPCQGKVCETVAVELGLRAGLSLSDLTQMTIRPPISPIPMSVLADYGGPGKGTA